MILDRDNFPTNRYAVESLARDLELELVWLQEEPENMGAWNFVHGRLHRVLRDDYRLRHVSRAESGSPATGSHAIHVQEQQQILDEALG